MNRLDPPVARYLSGKLPSHSSSSKLASNFESLDRNALIFVFHKEGLMTLEGKPTKRAAHLGLVDACDSYLVWNLELTEAVILKLGINTKRVYVNQEIDRKNDNGEPKWVNLGTIGTYFGVTANAVGKWLDTLGLREGKGGEGSQKAIDMGLSMMSEMNAGGKKTRKITMWNLFPTMEVLKQAGHALDFNYEDNLKARGRNSDVTVTSIEHRTKEFATEFIKLFKDPATRTQCAKLVAKTPRGIQERAEKLMNKPGFLTQGTYKKYVK